MTSARCAVVAAILVAAWATGVDDNSPLSLLQKNARGLVAADEPEAISLDGVMQGPPPDCEPTKRMDIGKANVEYSNLGGMGPDTDAPEGLLFTNVLAGTGNNVDLLVRTISEYTPHNSNRNGRVNSFGRINVATGTDVALEFEFQDGTTHEPYLMQPFTITFVDLDEQKDDGYGREQIIVRDEHEYIISDNSRVQVTGQGGASVFSSTEFGAGSDNPRDAMGLTQVQKEKSVQLVFPSVSMFTVTLSAGAIPDTFSTSGRNMLFAGQTNVFCPPDEPLPPNAACDTMVCPAGWKLKKKKRIDGVFCEAQTCTEEADLATCCMADLCSTARHLSLSQGLARNNLGNLGPDSGEEGMLFRNVFPESGEKVHMLVSAGVGYERVPNVLNGVKDKVGKISLVTGGKVNLTFSFLDGITNEPKTVGKFYMSFLDFDERQEVGRAREFVTLSNFIKYTVSGTSVVGTIARNALGSHVTLHSTTYGNGADNVADTHHMTQSQLDKSVSVLLPELNSFDIEFEVGRVNNQGTNNRFLQFAGVTNLVCDNLQTFSPTPAPTPATTTTTTTPVPTPVPTPSPTASPTVPSTCGNVCNAGMAYKKCAFWGDPHYTKTFRGAPPNYADHFNLQGTGIQTLAATACGSVEIQSVQCPWWGGSASVMVGVAMRVGSSVVSIVGNTLRNDGGVAVSGGNPWTVISGDTCVNLWVRTNGNGAGTPGRSYYMDMELKMDEPSSMGNCHGDRVQRHPAPNDVLFTSDQLGSLCGQCRFACTGSLLLDTADPEFSGPEDAETKAVPSPAEMCEQAGVSYDSADAACLKLGQKTVEGSTTFMHDSCILDYCAANGDASVIDNEIATERHFEEDDGLVESS